MEPLQKHSLCDRCSVVDLSPLTAPLPTCQESHREPAKVYEEKRAVYIHDFELDHAKSNHQCVLCNIIVVCARRTGEEHALGHKSVSIRPKLAWVADVGDASQSRQSTRLHRTGQLHVWFHEVKNYQEFFYEVESDEDPETTMEEGKVHSSEDQTRSWVRVGDNIMLKSAAASWMLDIIKHGELSPDKRLPIARHADKTVMRNWLSKCDHSHSHLPGASGSTSRILQTIIRRMPISRHPDKSIFRKWLSKYYQVHSHFPDANGPTSRIVQMITLRFVRVINTSTGDIKTLSSVKNFVALSYVWGSRTEPDQSLKAFPITAYPATIRDAATLARSLGFNWLWVDRICIDQSNANEKAALIPYIKDIFAAASLTIVAASGDGAHFGLPGSLHTARLGETPLKIDSPAGTLGDTLHLLPAQPGFNSLLNASGWRTRGWTFEEEVFSRRLLYVFPTEIFFSCDNGTYRESTGDQFSPDPAGSTWSDFGATPPLIAGELNVAMQKRGKSSTKLITARQFVRAVEEYTSRSLTFEEDRVEAFAGLIMASTDENDRISEASLFKHGHPLSFSETAMTWHPKSDSPTRLPANGRPFAPSWSWASAGSKVHFLDNGEEKFRANYFEYSAEGELDIVGVPSQTKLSDYLRLAFPSELIDSRPWLETVPIDLSPSDLKATTPSDVVSPRSQMLPTLHLITIVFEAMLEKASEGVYSMRLIDDPDAMITGHWGTTSSFKSGRQKFAVVAGNASICIMALKEEESGGCFSRIGLLKVGWYNTQSLIYIMAASGAHWEYVRLI